MNPLQAVFNSFVYPTRSDRNSMRTLGPGHRCCHWLARVVTCGRWPHFSGRGKAGWNGAGADVTRHTDVVEQDVYEDITSSEVT